MRYHALRRLFESLRCAPKRQRRRRASAGLPAAAEERRLLAVEALEERVLITHVVDPTLTIITHGFQPYGFGIPPWATTMAAVIGSQLDTRGDQVDSAPSETANYTIKVEPDFEPTWPDHPDANVTLLVDWQAGFLGSADNGLFDFVRADAAASKLADAIGKFLDKQSEQWDVLTIGHSRGAIFNSALLKKLDEQAHPLLHYVEMVMLDPTASVLHGDSEVDPEVVPVNVDRVLNYDDDLEIDKEVSIGLQRAGFLAAITGHTFTGAALVGAGIAFDTEEGYTVHPAQIDSNQPVRDSVEPWIVPVWWQPRSWESHFAVPHWYIGNRILRDVEGFLNAKDAHLPIAEPVEPKLVVGPAPEESVTDNRDDFADTSQDARIVELNSAFRNDQVFGYIDHVGDRDRFKVTTRRDGNLKVETGFNGLSSSLNSYVAVFDANENLLQARSANGARNAAQVFLTDVKAGDTFYIQVAGVGSSTGAYQLLVSQPADAPPPDPADNPAPPRVFHDSAGQTINGSREILLTSFNKGDDSGRIDADDDLDHYKFVAQSTGEIEVEVVPRKNLQTLITFFDGIEGKDTDASDDDGISYIRYGVVASGTYHIRVESLDGQGRGEYEVHIRPYDSASAPGNSGTDGPPGPLPGWGGVRGVTINLDANGNGSSRGGIDDPQDVDWFQIDGAQAGFMELRLAGVNDDLKPFITAFRADGGGIDTDSGEFDGQAKVAFEVGEGERIIVAVSSANGRSTGTYTLDVLQPASLPDDDWPDFGEPPYNMEPQITDEGDGSLRGRIERPDDDDWVRIPLAGQGIMTVEVNTDGSTLVPFLELSRDGTSNAFFETDDGRDGRAVITFLPEVGKTVVFAKISGLDGTVGRYTLNTWRTTNPGDDYPDAGGVFLQRRELPADGQLFNSGGIDGPGDSDNFHIRAKQPGHVAVQVIPLTEGFEPFFSRARQHSDPDERTGTSGGGSGRGGRAYEMLPGIYPADDNWIVVDVKAGGNSTTPIGNYIVHVRQIQSIDDIDPETVGIEASPILLDGSGNGSLPGTPNEGEVPPAINHTGDVDVFQVVAAADRPMTFTVDGSQVAGGVFLRIYDASGNAVGGDHSLDHDTGTNGLARVTVEAFRRDLYYVEVSAYDGASAGGYIVTVTQEEDDHPDAPTFTPREGQTRDATVIALDATGFGEATGRIGTTDENNSQVGDHDVFQVTAATSGQFTITVEATDDQLDTFLRVYDSHGNLVAIDDDSGDGRDSSVTFDTFMNESYLIDVSGYGERSIGAYRVTVQSAESPRQLFIGTFDDFSGPRLSEQRFRWSTSGDATAQQAGGVVVLNADGTGSNNDQNSATLETRATISGDIEFDFTPRLGDEENSASMEFTDGTNFIRILLEPDGSGDVRLAVSSNGYVQLSNSGPQTLVESRSYHLKLRQDADGIAILLNANPTAVASFAGSLKPDTFLRTSVNALRLPLYDDFNDNTIDGNRWSTTGEVREEGNRLHLWMYRNGGLRYSQATTANKPGGHDILGFKLNSDRTAGTVGGGQAESEVSLTNGTDSIIIKWLNDVNQFVLRATGYYGSGEIFRWDPDQLGPAETPDGPLEVRQNGGNIEVLHNNTVQHTFQNKTIRPGSYFRAEAYGQNGENGPLNRDYDITIDDLQLYAGQGRFAEIALDNLSGELALPDDAFAVPYDDFDDNTIDFDRWQIAGTVEEREGALKIPLFKNGQAISGFATTAGVPGGENLRGFRLDTNRTNEPKRLTGWETNAWAKLTNGKDTIRIRHHLENKTFELNSYGAYGERTVHVSVPDGEFPDGPIEVRERDGSIEVLHNGSVKLLISGQTIRAGSWFEFEAHGNPFGQPMNDPPENFDVQIDNLEFYVAPDPYDATVPPSVNADSDTGSSNSDQVTKLTTFNIEWAPLADGTFYQWRRGDIGTGGMVTYGPWSAPQSPTIAQVNVPMEGTFVVSARPVSLDGIVGTESVRGILVDQTAPHVTIDILLTGDSTPTLTGTVDDPGAAISVVVAGQSLIATNNGDGSWSVAVANALGEGVFDVQVTATDVAGNMATDATVDELTISDAAAAAVNRFDFGTGSSSLQEDFKRVTGGSLYSSGTGYGWQSAVYSLDRGIGTALSRDLTFGPLGTFLVDLPQGTYEVRLTMGDEGPYRHDQSIYLEDALVETVDINAREVITRAYTVSVSDGQLNVALDGRGGADPNMVISALEITEVDSARQFDFGTATSPLEVDYTLVAGGTLYESGRGYGWQSAVFNLDRGTGTELSRDLNFAPTGTFLVDLDNGSYSVELTLGDEGRYPHDQAVYLEGSQVDLVSTAGFEMRTRTYSVTVSDGQLELWLDGQGGIDPNMVISGLRITPADTNLQLALRDDAITENGGSTTGTVTRTGDTRSALTVSLTSSDESEATVPTSVTIAAGASSASFTITAANDDEADGTQTVTITASAASINPASAELDVSDDEPPALFSGGFDFGTGSSPLQGGYTQVAPGTIYDSSSGYGWQNSVHGIDRGAGSDLTRDLNFSPLGTFLVDMADGTYDVSVTLGDTGPYGHDQSIYLEGSHVETVVTDAYEIVTRTYTVTVSGGQLTLLLDGRGGIDPNMVISGLRITPADTFLQLTLRDDAITENGGSTTGTVTRTGDTRSALTVSLTSSDESEATVPASVTIAAGASSASFTITAANDDEADGTQTVTITASAASINPASAELDVSDDEPPALFSGGFDFGTGSSPLQGGYTQVAPGTIYDSSSGYGWQNSIHGIDRGAGSDLTRDLNFAPLGTFLVDMADGTYDVSVTLGDTGPYGHDQSIYLEESHVETVVTDAYEIVTRTYTVAVSGGQLTMLLDGRGGIDPNMVISGLQIRPFVAVGSQNYDDYKAL